jgi:SAM-dependent methyltransferase
MSKERFSFYKEYPKTCKPDDFWGQVKRTVNGKPVSQEQIDMIVKSIVEGLNLKHNDTLLDLCCGNGALSNLLFSYCSGGLGVDFSEYLISVANRFFSDYEKNREYILNDVVSFCENPVEPMRFTKAVCYGSFSFIEHERAEKLLCLLKMNFSNLKLVYIGNCPDKSLLSEFFKNRPFEPGVENDPDSPIGIWRTRDEFELLAFNTGWKISFRKMPPSFYASHYRYDVILTNEK